MQLMMFSKLRQRLTAPIFCFLLVLGSDAYAASIWSNAITGSSADGNPYTIGDVKDANISVSGIGAGSGVTANAGGGRYNFNNWSSTLDANDYLSWTLTPNSGFSIDLNFLSGNWQRSSTGPNAYALRSSLDGYTSNIAAGAITGSGSQAAFNLDLSASSLNAITSAVTFRLFASGGTAASGTFSVNDFLFDGAVSALVVGNNSVITAPASASFGRVMQNQSPSTSFNLSKTGSDATTYTATPTSGIEVTADGSIAGGAQSETIGLQLQSNLLGSGSTGTKSYTVTIDNTAANSAAAGQGSADLNDIVNVGATVVANRAIHATSVNLGSVIVGATTGVQQSSLTTTGDDDNNTRVTANGTVATDGAVTVAAAASQLFDDAADNTSRNITGSFTSAGAKSGTIDLSVTGEGLTGESVNTVSVAYTASAFDPSWGAFLSNNGQSLTLDLGSFLQGSGVQAISESVYNVLQTAGFTAELDLDSIVGTGDTAILFTDLTNGEFSALAAGQANAYGFLASFDTSASPGTYSATYTIGLSDADGFEGASAPGTQSLTLNLTGEIVPEPGPFALALLGLALTIARVRSTRR